MSVTFKKEGLQDFMGMTRDVGATLVVAFDWAGTRPAPTFSDTPRDPKDPLFFFVVWVGPDNKGTTVAGGREDKKVLDGPDDLEAVADLQRGWDRTAVDTLVLHPAPSSHLNVDKSIREEYGITEGLIRISVGIEEAEDIIHDLNQALA